MSEPIDSDDASPWQVLGVEVGCSQSELKQAYAKQLKLHRPDKDPDGFRRVRDAYEFLRNFDFSPNKPSEAIDAAIVRVVEKNDSANDAPVAEKTSDDNALPELDLKPVAITSFGQDTPPQPDAPEPQWSINFREARALAANKQWAEALDKIDAIKKEMEATGSAEIAAALVECAKGIALMNWNYAHRLGSLAFPLLTAYSRNAQMDELDRLIQAAKEIQHVPVKDRSTLAQCLAAGEADTSNPDVKAAMQTLARQPRAYTAQQYFKERFPNLNITPRNVQIPKARMTTSTPSDSGSGCSFPWYILVIISAIARLASMGGSSSSSSPSYQPYSPPSNYERKIQIEELQRIIKQNENAERISKRTTPQTTPMNTDEVIKYFLDRAKEKKNGAPNFQTNPQLNQ